MSTGETPKSDAFVLTIPKQTLINAFIVAALVGAFLYFNYKGDGTKKPFPAGVHSCPSDCNCNHGRRDPFYPNGATGQTGQVPTVEVK